MGDVGDGSRTGSSSPGRAILVIAVATAFATGALAGWLLGREKPRAGRVLSDEVYLVGAGDSPVYGPAAALVTIVEFADATRPACRRADAVLRRAADASPGSVRVVWKHFSPAAASSPEFQWSAQAGVAAGLAGKFWELLGKIGGMTGTIDPERLAGALTAIGLDGKRIGDELLRAAHRTRVAVDLDTAARLGIARAPAIFVNGRLLAGDPTPERVRRAIDEAMPGARLLVARGVALDQVYWELIRAGRSTLEGAPLPSPAVAPHPAGGPDALPLVPPKQDAAPADGAQT